MKFNINDEVWVKLTERGRRNYAAYFTRLTLDPLPLYECNGYARFQLWVLMETFGPSTSHGSDPNFDTTILIGEEP